MTGSYGRRCRGARVAGQDLRRISSRQKMPGHMWSRVCIVTDMKEWVNLTQAEGTVACSRLVLTHQVINPFQVWQSSKQCLEATVIITLKKENTEIRKALNKSINNLSHFRSSDSFVGIAERYRVLRPDFDSTHGDKAFSFTQRPERLSSSVSFLSSRYMELFTRCQKSWLVTLTTHRHLEQKSRVLELYL
jgi:hypothetical protein